MGLSLTDRQKAELKNLATDFHNRPTDRATQAILRLLWDTGHFRNPSDPTEVKEEDLPKLTLKDKVVKTAIRSYQVMNSVAFSHATAAVYGEQPLYSGELGPATARLFTVERCGCPDFAMETGRGSWPVGCHKPGIHAITVNMVKTRMPSFLGRKDDPNSICERAWKLCTQAYADIGMLLIREDGNTNANTTITWEKGSGWIGLAIVPQNPQCNERIWAKFDTAYNPSDILNQWGRLFAHEVGHNMSMGHSQGGIMNSFIVSGPFLPNAWRGDSSEPILTRYFGGEPVDLDDGDDDGDGNGPEIIAGSYSNTYRFGGYIVTDSGERRMTKI